MEASWMIPPSWQGFSRSPLSIADLESMVLGKELLRWWVCMNITIIMAFFSNIFFSTFLMEQQLHKSMAQYYIQLLLTPTFLIFLHFQNFQQETV